MANTRFLSVLFGSLLVASIAVAADPVYPPWDKPTAELPKYVVAPADRFTLFADFANPKADGLPVYVVNRTSEPIRLKTQDYPRK